MPCNHALVQDVTIVSVSGSQVTFSTRSTSLQSRNFTVHQNEIYLPTPADGNIPASVPIAPNQVGPLYLSRVGWEVKANGAAEYIYGKDIPGYAVFKWPQCGGNYPHPHYADLDVMISSIVLTGLYGNQSVKLDLVTDCERPCHIHWNQTSLLTFELTAAAMKLHKLPSTVEVWPFSIVVHGASTNPVRPKGKTNISLWEKVDLRSTITLLPGAKSVQISLTPDGMADFYTAARFLDKLLRGEDFLGRTELLARMKAQGQLAGELVEVVEKLATL